MNITQVPPGGWQFHEPSTGWWAPHPIGYTLDQQTNNVIKHRLANPAMVAKFKLATDFESVKREVIRFQQKRGALEGDPLPKLTPPRSTPQLSGAVKQAVAVVRKMAAGAALLMEWEESGLPHVSEVTANERASICTTCPKNEKGKALTDIFTVPVANMIKKKMERLNDLNLHTAYDSELATCQACLCPMRTKVWMPTELVLKRLKPEQIAELQPEKPKCWILQELSLRTSSSPKAPSPEKTSPDLSVAGS